MSRSIDTNVISPTELQTFSRNPVSWLLKKYTMFGAGGSLKARGLGEHIVGTVESVVGSNVHDALEVGLKEFKNVYNNAMSAQPGMNNVLTAIDKASTLAAKSLESSGVPVAPHAGYMKDNITRIGGMYNKTVTDLIKRGHSMEKIKAGVSLNVERGVMTYAGTESPTNKIIKGRYDVNMVNMIDKVVDGFDHKIMNSRSMLNKLNEFGNQPKAYMYGIAKSLPGDFSKIIKDFDFNFHYLASVPAGSPDGVRASKVISHTNIDMAAVEKELLETIAEAESIKMIASERVGRGGIKEFKKFLSEEMMKYTDKVSGDILSPTIDDLKYNWSTDDLFIKDVMDTEGLNGQKFLSSMAKKYDTVTDVEFNKHEEMVFGNKTKESIDDYLTASQERIQKLKDKYSTGKFGKMPIALDDRIKGNETLLKESYDSLKYMQRGRFVDAVTKSAYTARAKIPFSILDEDLRGRWMTERMRKGLEFTTRDRIREITGAVGLGSRSALIEDKVLNAVYTDKSMVEKLHHTAVENIRTTMHHEGLGLSEYNISRVLKRPDLWIDRNMAAIIDDRVFSDTVYNIMGQNKEKLEKLIGKITPGRFKDGYPELLEAVKTGFVKHNIKAESVETFRKQLAKSQMFGSLIKQKSVKGSRFPVSTAFITGILGYLAGSERVVTTYARKMEKAAEYMMHQDNEIDAGQHASAYTNARRLLLSDFGSSYRKFGPVSSIFSKLAASGVKYANKLKDLLSREVGTRAIPGDFINAVKASKGGDILKNAIDEFRNGPLGPAAWFAGTAAGSFIVSGFLTNIKSDDTIHKEIESRKRRFKQLRQANWNTDSSMEEPQSNLRAGYKAHTEFGSGVYLAGIGKNMFQTFMTGIEAIGARISTKGLSGTTTYMLKELAPRKAAVVSTEAVNGSLWSRVKSIANKAKSKIDEVLPEAWRSGQSSKAADMVAEAARGTKDIAQDTKIRRYLGNRKTRIAVEAGLVATPITGKKTEPPAIQKRTLLGDDQRGNEVIYSRALHNTSSAPNVNTREGLNSRISRIGETTEVKPKVIGSEADEIIMTGPVKSTQYTNVDINRWNSLPDSLKQIREGTGALTLSYAQARNNNVPNVIKAPKIGNKDTYQIDPSFSKLTGNRVVTPMNLSPRNVPIHDPRRTTDLIESWGNRKYNYNNQITAGSALLLPKGSFA